MERSPEFDAAVLGVLKAGGFFVPLDPTYPPDRLRYMVEAARSSVLLIRRRDLIEDFAPPSTQTLYLDEIPDPAAPEVDGPLVSGATPESALYAIFTSGSTGRPKGVQVEHRHLISHLRGILERLDLPRHATIPTVSTISADVGHTPIFGSLTTGGCLHVVSEERATSPDALSEYVARHDLDFLKIVPSHLNALRHSAGDGFHLPRKKMLVGGETFYWRDARELQAMVPQLGIFNHYGPTETTVGVMTYHLRVGDETELPMATSWLPLGRPLPGARIYVLGRRGEPVAVGVPGEISIGGASVSRGYLHQPRLTAERFLPDAVGGEPGQRLYKTGDLARTLPDGQLEFLGRVDLQVKVRGFRVELEEIQGLLRNHPDLQAAVVVTSEKDATPGDSRLVAYVVAGSEPAPTAAGLRAELARTLPSYMVPGTIVFLDALPLNQNGKVDRRALPDLDRPQGEEAEEIVAPRSAVEAMVAGIWAEALGAEQISVEADYFELGGNSLTAIRILSRLKEAFGVNVAPQRFFVAANVARLAEVIEEARAGDGTAEYARVTDLDVEIELDPAIAVGPQAAPPVVGDPRAVLLTGATGFVGSFLLHELLRQTRARVYCLVRAADPEEGMDRLRRSLEGYRLWDESSRPRIVALPGDLSRPLLGLTPEHFESLAESLDAVYHNGALVNFAYPYQALKRPNVLGTEEVLRFACRRTIKPVHFASTISVFDSAAFEARATVNEDDDPADSRNLPDGYVQSKWVGERLVKLAGARGLPIAIYRLGRVSWHSQSGSWAESDFVHRMMRSCVQLGGAPELGQLTSLTPVDYVSRALVALSLGEEHLGRAFHLANPEPVPWSRLVQWIDSRGYPLARWSFEHWQSQLLESVRRSSDNALYPMAAFSAGHRPHEQTERQIRHLERQPSVVKCDRTSAALEKLGICLPAIDDRVVDAYFSAAQETGMLPAPAGVYTTESDAGSMSRV